MFYAPAQALLGCWLCRGSTAPTLRTPLLAAAAHPPPRQLCITLRVVILPAEMVVFRVLQLAECRAAWGPPPRPVIERAIPRPRALPVRQAAAQLRLPAGGPAPQTERVGSRPPLSRHGARSPVDWQPGRCVLAIALSPPQRPGGSRGRRRRTAPTLLERCGQPAAPATDNMRGAVTNEHFFGVGHETMHRPLGPWVASTSSVSHQSQGATPAKGKWFNGSHAWVHRARGEALNSSYQTATGGLQETYSRAHDARQSSRCSACLGARGLPGNRARATEGLLPAWEQRPAAAFPGGSNARRRWGGDLYSAS